MWVTRIRLLSLNILLLNNGHAKRYRHAMSSNKCWAIFHVTRAIFVARLCRLTKFAQHFPNLGDKSRATFSEWCHVIGQLGLTNHTGAVFTMDTVWTKEDVDLILMKLSGRRRFYSKMSPAVVKMSLAGDFSGWGGAILLHVTGRCTHQSLT